ncbi:hypothetical protein D3C80_1128080 [compost metagenome]
MLSTLKLYGFRILQTSPESATENWWNFEKIAIVQHLILRYDTARFSIPVQWRKLRLHLIVSSQCFLRIALPETIADVSMAPATKSEQEVL